jgi:hypothetical protein
MSVQSSAKAGLMAAALIASMTQLAVAGGAGPELPAGKSMAKSAMGVMTHDPRKLVNTYISSGNGGSLAANTFNFIESRTVDCNKTVGCLIEQDSMVQLSPGGGNWAICLSVNGTYTTCQFQGHLPDVGSYVVGNARGNVLVAQGVHTVQTDVYTANASTLAQWQTSHRVFRQ